MSNIFGLVRERVVIAGIPLLKCNSLTPAERIWFQENTEEEEKEFNRGYLKFVATVQKQLGLTEEYEAYDLVKRYYNGTIEDESQANRIELLAMKNPLPTRESALIKQLTYILNSRIIKPEFPVEAFADAFGLTYAGEWTIEFTKATEELQGEFKKFFDGEATKSNGELKGDPIEGKAQTTVPATETVAPTS